MASHAASASGSNVETLAAGASIDRVPPSAVVGYDGFHRFVVPVTACSPEVSPSDASAHPRGNPTDRKVNVDGVLTTDTHKNNRRRDVCLVNDTTVAGGVGGLSFFYPVGAHSRAVMKCHTALLQRVCRCVAWQPISGLPSAAPAKGCHPGPGGCTQRGMECVLRGPRTVLLQMATRFCCPRQY